MARLRSMAVCLLAFALVGGGSVIVSTGAQASTICNGTISNTTISGDVVVPSNANCVLNNVVVTGNVTASSPNQLLTFGGSIGGSLSVNGFQTNSTPSSICGTSIGSNAVIQNMPANATSSPNFNLGDTEDFFAGFGACTPVSVTGSVTISNNRSREEMSNDTIGGSVSIMNNTAQVEVENNTIQKNLTCSGNTNLTNGGDPNTVTGSRTGQCTGNF